MKLKDSLMEYQTLINGVQRLIQYLILNPYSNFQLKIGLIGLLEPTGDKSNYSPEPRLSR
ncbi:hypothetical protein A6770_00690 [Nostoc minutum NIES-26]|uniref:Uncharacterized protein n=1 Tax=Nostoc minutum NIES-26 TaxID=1844469 RepID=A0A367QXL9_9NOSO|nr:hypothetical protein A6770_00690 [Nostoc minutum NIES-26]